MIEGKFITTETAIQAAQKGEEKFFILFQMINLDITNIHGRCFGIRSHKAFLKFTHKNISVFRGHYRLHCSAMNLKIVSAIENKIIMA